MTLAIFLAVFPVAFVAIGCGVMYLLSRLSGWNDLVAAYGYRGEIRGMSRTFQSASIGYWRWFLVRFRACLGVNVDSGILILRPWFVFGLFQPPLAIPLDDLTRSDRQILFWRACKLQAVARPRVIILVSQGLAQWIEASAGRPIKSAATRVA